MTFWGTVESGTVEAGTVKTFLILQENTVSNLNDNGNFGFPTMENEIKTVVQEF